MTNREFASRAAARIGCAVAFSAALAVGLGVPATRAHPLQDMVEKPGSADLLTQTASYHGYANGYARGASDLENGTDTRPREDETFVRASTGYTSELGAIDAYERSYRAAYTRGYGDASAGLGRDPELEAPPVPPGRSFGAAQPAVEGDEAIRSMSVATATGYEAGYTQGVADNQRNASYAYRDQAVYRAAKAGYTPSLGDELRYQIVFRQIYARGYSDGFNGRARYLPDSAQVRDSAGPVARTPPAGGLSAILRTAATSGYREGFVHGEADRVAARAFDYRQHAAFRQATIGYDRDWNVELEYQATFRQGYALGYKTAYDGRGRDASYEGER